MRPYLIHAPFILELIWFRRHVNKILTTNAKVSNHWTTFKMYVLTLFHIQTLSIDGPLLLNKLPEKILDELSSYWIAKEVWSLETNQNMKILLHALKKEEDQNDVPNR